MKVIMPNKYALPKINTRSMEQPDFVSFHLIGLKKFPFSMLPQKKWKERNILWLMWGKTKTETPKRYFEIHWEGQTMSKHLSFRSSTPFLLFFTRGGNCSGARESETCNFLWDGLQKSYAVLSEIVMG